MQIFSHSNNFAVIETSDSLMVWYQENTVDMIWYLISVPLVYVRSVLQYVWLFVVVKNNSL